MHVKRRPAPDTPSLSILLLVMFLDVLCYGMTLPLLPLYTQALGGAAAMAGAIAAGYATMQLVSGPLLGALSDQHGRKPVLLVCFAGTVLSYTLVAGSLVSGLPLWPALVVAVLIDGITGGNLSTAYAYISDSSTPERRAVALGTAGAAFGLGIMLGPVLGGTLSTSGLRLPAIIAACIALLNLLISTLWLRESLPSERRAAQLRWTLSSGFDTLRALLREAPGSRGLLAAIFFANLAFAGLQVNFPLFSAARFNWNAQQISYFFAFVGLCAVLTQGLLLRIVRRFMHDHTLALSGLVALALGLLAVALVPSGAALYVAAGIAALGSGVCLPVLSALLSNALPDDRQGALMGGTQTIIALANIGAPLIATAAFTLIAINAPYLTAAGIVLLGLVAAARAFGQIK
jgi:MFS transporter, DHA1 family, tetracycline resistance protein